MGNSIDAVVVDDVVVVVVALVLVLDVVVTDVDVIVCSAGGSHNSRNLPLPPGGDASSDGGRKRRDWTNHEFVRACRRLGWLSNLSEEGSQTLSLDAVLSLSTVSSELKLLFRLKEKGLYRNLSRIDYTASVDN